CEPRPQLEARRALLVAPLAATAGLRERAGHATAPPAPLQTPAGAEKPVPENLRTTCTEKSSGVTRSPTPRAPVIADALPLRACAAAPARPREPRRGARSLLRSGAHGSRTGCLRGRAGCGVTEQVSL